MVYPGILSNNYDRVMPRITLSVVIAPDLRVEPEHAALLEAVRNTGSISAAARQTGIPYKRAWMLLDAMNRAFRERVVEAITGGARGGGAVLTPFGADLLERYRRMSMAAEAATAADLTQFVRSTRKMGR